LIVVVDTNVWISALVFSKALAGANVLVSGDKDLLSLGSYGDTKIVTPLEYVELPL
jgi:predicted nucleic acid-binding protein